MGRARHGANGDMDMQVTFAGGLDDLGERLAAKRAEAAHGGKTVWEEYLRRRRCSVICIPCTGAAVCLLRRL